MTATVNRTGPTKSRRTRADIDAIKAGIVSILREERPATVRQIFYRLESAGLIAKTEGEYKQTVCRLLAEMRRDQVIPYTWIADSTRWMRKPITYGSALEAVTATARLYRQAIWRDHDEYVEVWLEKEALAGVLFDVTDEYDVPIMVIRGYASLSFLYGAAAAIRSVDKPTTIYYFGDLDPSGVDIAHKVEQELRGFAPAVPIEFERVAVNRWQVEALRLPTRPTKTSDSRSRNFKGESVEVDAISPTMLRAMARECIESHLPDGALDAATVAEQSERSIITKFIETMGSAS